MVRSNIPSAPAQTILSGVTATAGEINYTDVTTAGTVQATKAVVVDGNKDVTGFRNVTATGAVQGATIAGTTSLTSPLIDAGSSGAAGSVDIFPTTASKGKIALTAADSAGDTTTTIVNASQAAARTYTIPDALADAQFLLGVQGTTARTATADGLTTGIIADAGREQFIVVTSGDANHIIALPTPTPGTRVALLNGATGYELRSSAPASVAINGGTGASAESAIAANTYVEMICVSATAWIGRSYNTAGVVAAVEVAA
jgi:hypothetical protein